MKRRLGGIYKALMEKEYKKAMSKRDFLKKEWIWILILILGGIAIGLALRVDQGKTGVGDCIRWICKEEIRCILWEASETICNVVVTYSTMLVAIVVFFYSMIDNKRLGIPYRRLIDYTIGSHTIPILFMVTLLLTVFMLMARCVPLKYTVYACIAYILFIQVFVIIEILKSTSYKHCKRVICRIERKRYVAGIGSGEEFNTEWAYFFSHLESAIHSEEFIPDKKELLIDFLWIPFCKSTGKPYGKVPCERNFTEMEKLERIYQFYFVNILSAFQNFDGEANHLERNQLYMGIRDFLLEFADKNDEDIENDMKMRYIYHMVLSGIMNGLMFSNVEDSIGLCRVVLSQCISNRDISRRQLYLFLLFQEMLSMVDVQMVLKHTKIGELGDWKPLEENDIAFCAEFWEIWTKMYAFSLYDKVRHFEVAIQTMSGRRNLSVTISRILITMKEKDKVKGRYDGEEYSNKDIAAEE